MLSKLICSECGHGFNAVTSWNPSGSHLAFCPVCGRCAWCTSAGTIDAGDVLPDSADADNAAAEESARADAGSTLSDSIGVDDDPFATR